MQNSNSTDDLKKTIGTRLREERERLSLSQVAFGKAGGVLRGAQINYENGERSPDSNYLHHIASIGADVMYILTGQRNENAATTPTELSYLRICRALPHNDARLAGNAALGGVLAMYGIQMGTYSPSNDDTQEAAQNGANYGKKDKP